MERMSRLDMALYIYQGHLDHMAVDFARRKQPYPLRTIERCFILIFN